jgi:hypothetical protein
LPKYFRDIGKSKPNILKSMWKRYPRIEQ